MANVFASPAGRGPKDVRHALSDSVAPYIAVSSVVFLAAIVILL